MNPQPIDMINGLTKYIETCRTKLFAWVTNPEEHPLACAEYLEAWMAFNAATKHLKKHRRDEMTFEDAKELMRVAGGPIRKLDREWKDA